MKRVIHFLIPKEKRFYDTLHRQLDYCAEACSLVCSESAVQKFQTITKEKHKLFSQIVNDLHETLVTPFDKEDIYRLAHGQDRLANKIMDLHVRMKLAHTQEATPWIHLLQEAMIYLKQMLSSLEKNEHVSSFVLREKVLLAQSMVYDEMATEKNKSAIPERFTSCLLLCEDIAAQYESIGVKHA